MALIKLDTRNLYLYVEVGILEEYKPDHEVEAIKNKVDEPKQFTFIEM